MSELIKAKTTSGDQDVSNLMSDPEVKKNNVNFSAAQLEHEVAIIGIACRFPGANDYNQYWQNLEQGINSISEIPPQRWDVEKYYSPYPETPNKSISKWAGLIEGIDQFDSQFFGISPREAIRMDPQQRIMLELSWSCIEDASYSPPKLSGGQIGVFIGACNYDYDQLQHKHEKNVNGHSGTGTWNCMLPNRISSFFNFHGPSIPIDTACSSSLLAVHYGINAINKCECEMALVGGVSVCCTPIRYIQMSQLGMLSPTGQCRTFSNDANGYVRGEGAGVILLKPLKKAIEDGDRLYGVIQGSAINHGGKAKTITSPNVYAQAQVIRSAYTNANIAPNTVSYIETHGTGTPLGDPIEINALKRGFRQLHKQHELTLPKKPYCALGAVKTNIGHLEGAAGIAGVIKVLLAMKHKKLPKIVNFKQLNPRIELKGSPFYIVTETQEWEQLQTETAKMLPRRAGVSSFGIGGVNAHVILEEPPENVKNQKSKVKSEVLLERPLHIFKLSGHTEKALKELAKKYVREVPPAGKEATDLQSNTEVSIQDICFSANTGRTDFADRLALVAQSKDELQEKLADFLQDNETNGVVTGKAENQEKKIAFLFTGQGSQYVGMGRQLYETQPTFKKILDQCNEILQEYLEVPLLEILYSKNEQKSSSSRINQTAYTQPTLFALEYALTKLWGSWGIQPDIVMGHSVGEYVAACVAGVFSLEDGLKLITMRGRLMQQLPSGGEMVSVMASESQVTEVIEEYSSSATIAAINGPESIVISGESGAIAAICSKLDGMGVKTKHLQVSHAFHSPLMEPMLAEFETVAKEVTYSHPRIPLISNVTGKKVGNEITTAEYWVDHIRQPVKFCHSIKTLDEQGYEVFIEIGPKPILLGMGRQCVTEDMGVWLPSLRPEVEEWQQMLSSLGQLYVKGFNVDWLGFDRDYTCQKVVLPKYPFQRQTYWLETEENGNNSIVNLVDPQKTGTLAQKLAKAGNLSAKEIELLPKLLELLVKEQQQQQKLTGIQDLLYEIEWRNQARFGQVLPTDKLLKPTEIEQPLNLVFTEFVNQGNLDGCQEIRTQLEELSVKYVVKAFLGMGWKYKPGDRLKKDSVAKEFKVIPSKRGLLNRILQILAEVKILQETQEQWEVLETLDEHVNPESECQILLNKYPSAIIEFTLLNRCASQLIGVLRGSVDAVQLVFPEGELASATRLYKETQGAIVINTVIHKAIAKATEKLPHSRGIRLLEIGGGTGGTTSHILPNLNPNQSEYVFTDIGALFVNKAKEKFQDYPFVRYQTLDIELDPLSQGFEPHQYDVIIAANVLHATSNMTQTITNVKKLLAPGGILILWEVTDRQRWIDLFAGGLEGWWKFNDLDLRPDHPLLSITKWKKLLSETGFSQVIALPENEEILETLSSYTVIIAQADETQLEETLEKGKTWLILADKQGVAQKLATKLRSLGEACTLVFSGEQYQQISPEEFTIDPHDPKEFEQLVGEIADLYGVVQCWSLEARISEKLNAQELADLSKLGCGTTLSLVQALIKKQSSQTLRLWLVTQGAQPVPHKNSVVPGIAQSSLWGMGKVIANEHPELNCRRIDLDPQQTIEQKGLVLWSEIWSQDKEDQIVLRGETRYVPRLVRYAPTQLETPLNIREDSTYLIAGGLGGVGLLVASWMAKQGAKNLVLVGRSSPSDVAQKKLTDLERMGAKVVIAEADISEVTSIAQVLSDIEESLPPLRGIINSAVVVDDALIDQYSWEKFSKALRPKIQGSWNLHNLTKDMSIDFFILFSSASSIFGSPGLGSYTAANAFQDTMAHYRRMIGLPAQTIQWPAVTETGLEIKFQTANQAKEKGLGIDAISPEKALEVLEVLMRSDAIEVGVLNIDWSERLIQYLNSRLFDDWKDDNQVASESSELLQQLKAAMVSERRELLRTHVSNEVARVLGIKSSQEVDWKQGFFSLGMDSLMAVELKGSLQKSFGCNLSPTLAFTYSTLDTLVDYLAEVVEEMLAVDDESTITQEISETEIQSDIDNLSDEEAEISLLDKLDNLGY